MPTDRISRVFQTVAGNTHQPWVDQTVQCLGNAGTCCPYPAFSDGVLSDAEMCDDGNAVPGDGCFCGQIETNYACDGGSPSSCAMCGPARVGVNCEDRNPQCALWASSGECQGNIGYMSLNCRASCGIGGCHTQHSVTSPAVFISVQLLAGQSDDDFSWKVWQRGHQSVRNTGTGSGYLICSQPGEEYDLEVIANRWNSSAGFRVTSGPPGSRVIVQEGPWGGRSTAVSFSNAGQLAEIPNVVDDDSCITVSFFGRDSPPATIPNHQATFGPATFNVGETEFVFTDPPNACGGSLANGWALAGKIAVAVRALSAVLPLPLFFCKAVPSLTCGPPRCVATVSSHIRQTWSGRLERWPFSL